MSGNETAAAGETSIHYDVAQASGSRTTGRRTRCVAVKQRVVQWSDSDSTDREPSPNSSTSWSPPRANRSPSVSMSPCRSMSPYRSLLPSPPPPLPLPLPPPLPPPPPSQSLSHDSPSVEFECAVCSESFQTKAEMKMHMKTSQGCGKPVLRVVQHKCNECGKVFANQKNVKQHWDDYHVGPKKKEQQQDRGLPPEQPQRQFTCHICERRFDRAEQLAVHLRRKHGRPDMDCETCGQRFSRRTDLNRHRRAVHLRQRPHQCYDCGQRFAQKSNMLEHRRAVHAANPKAAFKCPRCEKWFSRKHNMTVHVRAVHDGQKQFKCPSCPRSYDQQSALDRHYAVLHAPASEGMPLFLCPVCGKRFSQKSNLTVHQRLHDAIQLLFACPVCHRTYTRKAALNKHACRPVEA